MIRALIIDDSAFNRVTISRMLDSAPDIQIVGTAVNGEDGIKQVLRHSPDVITLDLEMPVMDGFAFLRWLMANRPTPVIAVSSQASERSVFKALELGAVDFIAKPGGRVSAKLPEIQEDLIRKVRSLSAVRLDNVKSRIRDDDPPAVATGKIALQKARAVDLVVIGASTGGPPALQSLFESLPLMPLPIVVAQHMPPLFTRLFAERVNRLTSYKVKEAEAEEPLIPGVVYIAPGGMQCEIAGEPDALRIKVRLKNAGEVYAPSVNRLFLSASERLGARVLAVVLTGMGDDGADGVRKIRERGGRTIAESEETAIIFGMPGEAIKTGAIQEVLPLPRIPSAIYKMALV